MAFILAAELPQAKPEKGIAVVARLQPVLQVGRDSVRYKVEIRLELDDVILDLR
jgi:hypothetical protein